jgi:hypothetical protein
MNDTGEHAISDLTAVFSVFRPTVYGLFLGAASPQGSREDKSFSQRRFNRGMEITQMKLLSSWMPSSYRNSCHPAWTARAPRK